MHEQNHLRLATSIVKRLQEAGYTALFAGGWVRDFVMGRPSADIDIATSAHPEQVMKLFPRSIAVGAQFGVVRVLSGDHEFEIATFRSDAQYVDGRRPTSVSLHSSPEEDAKRRDFTINGLFYDPIHKQIDDFVGGQEDIRRKVIRSIGEPSSRFKEDRLRIIRAIRFKNVLQFTIEDETWKAMCAEASYVVPAVSPERIWQELTKMMNKGVLTSSLCDMQRCGLLSQLFPPLQQCSGTVLEERLAMIQKCPGKSLISALCLLFLGEQASYLRDIGGAYHLSNKEKKVAELFWTYGLFQKRLSKIDLVRLYAIPEWEEYAAAAAAARHDPGAFLRRHKKAAQELSFWVSQLRTNSFFVTGQDLKDKGVLPGLEMGRLLDKAFQLSISLQLKNKEKILKALFE